MSEKFSSGTINPKQKKKHFDSRGTMFVHYQNFVGLWGLYFMCNWFVALQYKTIPNFCYKFVQT